MKVLKLFPTLVFGLTLFGVLAHGAWHMDSKSGTGTVTFRAVARPGGVKIDGKSTDQPKEALTWTFKIDGLDVAGDAKILLDSLDTGLSLRNTHLREKYFDTKAHPSATFKMTSMKLPKEFEAGDISTEGVLFEGILTLKGVAKPVSGKAKVTRKAQRLEMNFDFKVKFTEYGIEKPSFMGVTVGEETDVAANFAGELQKK